MSGERRKENEKILVRIEDVLVRAPDPPQHVVVLLELYIILALLATFTVRQSSNLPAQSLLHLVEQLLMRHAWVHTNGDQVVLDPVENFDLDERRMRIARRDRRCPCTPICTPTAPGRPCR